MTILDSPGLIRALGQRPSSRRPPLRHVTRLGGTASDAPYGSAGEVGGKL
jgi:hypothetical protein